MPLSYVLGIVLISRLFCFCSPRDLNMLAESEGSQKLEYHDHNKSKFFHS